MSNRHTALLLVVILALAYLFAWGSRRSQPAQVQVVVVSDSLLHETIVAQRDTIEALRRCVRALQGGARYPICNPR